MTRGTPRRISDRGRNRRRPDTALQGGLLTRANSRTYRILLELLDGRPPLDEFFRGTETSLAMGFRIDL